ADSLLVHGGDHQAAAGLLAQQALVLDALERLAHGGAAQLQQSRDLDLAQAPAGRELPRADAALDLVVGGVRLRTGLRYGHGGLHCVLIYIFAYKKENANRDAKKA